MEDNSALTRHQLLACLDALQREPETLSAQFPHLAPRLAKAATAIEHGGVLEDDGHTAMVQSKREAAVWYPVNGACPCAASQHRSEVCYHRLALRRYQKVCERMLDEQERYDLIPDTGVTDTTRPPVIRSEWVVSIQGRQCIRIEGLLELAHTRGLVRLETTVV
jgi:hypothetical protein